MNNNYTVIYLDLIDKLLVSDNHHHKYLFEGKLTDIEQAKDALLEAYDKDLLSLEAAKDKAYDELEKLKLNKGGSDVK